MRQYWGGLRMKTVPVCAVALAFVCIATVSMAVSYFSPLICFALPDFHLMMAPAPTWNAMQGHWRLWF